MVPEPNMREIENTAKSITLKTSAKADYAQYQVDTTEVFFKPTLMFTSRTYKLKVKNTSLIAMNYKVKLASAETGQYDPGFFSVGPK